MLYMSPVRSSGPVVVEMVIYLLLLWDEDVLINIEKQTLRQTPIGVRIP